MISKAALEQLPPFQARTIVEELRKGSVPVKYVSFFSVGREKWLKFIDDDLQHYIAEGGSKVRFINGNYGDGKTHFMSIIRHMALEQGFAVSFVVLTREVPIHKFEVVYQQITKQLCGQFEGVGIRHLLDHWADGLKETLESVPAEDGSFKANLATLSEQLRNLPGMDLNFANALVAFAEKRLIPVNEANEADDSEQAIETLYQWFEGGKVAKKDLKPFHVFEALNKSNGKSLLKSLNALLRSMNYKGLVLLMDELETVIAQSASIRNAAYENVRLLIDNTEDSENLYIFFSIIPDILLSEKGFRSYDALWSRVRSIGEGKRLNYRGVLIDLHRTPLEVNELLELGITLRKMHALSFRWDASEMIKDDFIKKACQAQEKMGMLSEVRLFIKQMIRYLDMAEQGEMPDDMDNGIAQHLVSSQQALEQEKREQLQPSWDA